MYKTSQIKVGFVSNTQSLVIIFDTMSIYRKPTICRREGSVSTQPVLTRSTSLIHLKNNKIFNILKVGVWTSTHIPILVGHPNDCSFIILKILATLFNSNMNSRLFTEYYRTTEFQIFITHKFKTVNKTLREQQKLRPKGAFSYKKILHHSIYIIYTLEGVLSLWKTRGDLENAFKCKI